MQINGGSFNGIINPLDCILWNTVLQKLSILFNISMIQLRSTNIDDNDGLKAELINKAYDSSRNWNNYQDSYVKKPTLQSPFASKNTHVRRKVRQSISDIEQTESNTSYRQIQPQQFKQQTRISPNFVFNQYNITDLTFSLINSEINITLLTVFFLIQITIRYFSIACLICLMVQTQGSFWQWILILMFNNFLYFVSIVKISIKFPETRSETILKDSFNSLHQSQHVQYFQVIDFNKLAKSILRGLIPPELSFLYIKNMKTSQRHLHIYVMINYIYSSIEAVLFYPFIIIYTIQAYTLLIESYGLIFYFSYATMILSQITFLSLSVLLTIHGCRKKGYLTQSKQS